MPVSQQTQAFIAVKQLALGLPKHAWRTIKWREGTAERLSSRFARMRVRVADGDDRFAECRAEEWLLIEWPEGEKEPTKGRGWRGFHHHATLCIAAFGS